jgi:hypothetical protein
MQGVAVHGLQRFFLTALDRRSHALFFSGMSHQQNPMSVGRLTGRHRIA